MSKLNKDILYALIEGAVILISNEEFKKFMCGTYNDGSTRGIVDCLKGEHKSPKEKKKEEKKLKKKYKKK